MSEHRSKAKKIADIFSDERTNVIDLAHQTANLLTPNSEVRLHNWLKWHYKMTEGYKAEVPEPIQLDNYDEN
jgi:hypothetical protein